MVQKIANKYKTLPIQLKATVWFVVCQAIQSGCKFFTMPFLVRLLTPEQYGIYSVFLSWINIISIFATLNLHSGVFSNAMLNFQNDRDRYIASAQSISLITTIICFILYLSFSNFWTTIFGLEQQYSVLMFIQILFTEGYLLWTGRQRYEYRYIKVLISTVLFSLVNIIIPILSVCFSAPPYRLSVLISTGIIVQVIFGALFIIYNYIKGKCFYQKKYWAYSLKFNVPLIPHYLSSIILGQADRVMIKNIIGPVEAGIYSFTYNISIVMNIITNSINNALVPYEYSKLRARDFKMLKSIADMSLVFIATLVVTFSLFAPEIIYILATEEYYEAVYLIPVIALSSYFVFTVNLTGNIEFFFEEKKFITVASSIGAVMNVFLNWLLIPKFGYFAAGYTTLFCYIMFSIAHYIFMKIVCNKNLNGIAVYNGKSFLFISIIVVLLCVGIMLIYDYWYIRYSLFLLILIILYLKRRFLKNFVLQLQRKIS